MESPICRLMYRVGDLPLPFDAEDNKFSALTMRFWTKDIRTDDSNHFSVNVNSNRQMRFDEYTRSIDGEASFYHSKNDGIRSHILPSAAPSGQLPCGKPIKHYSPSTQRDTDVIFVLILSIWWREFRPIRTLLSWSFSFEFWWKSAETWRKE